MASGSIWAIVSCQGVADEIRDAVDKGKFADARSLSYQSTALAKKLASAVQEKGGHLHFFLQERQVLEIPSTVAEELPVYLDSYMKELPGLIAVGLGLTFNEAVSAMKASAITGEIEMYDPNDQKFGSAHEYYKAEGAPGESPYELPVNMFDPTVPEADPIEDEEKFISRPGIEEELQAQASLISALAQVMSGQAGQQPQQPRDLREALEGGQVDGYQPQQPQQQQAPQQAPEKKESKKSKDSEDSDEDSESSSDSNENMKDLLHNVQSSIPQLMALRTKDPEAYDSAMKLMHKLVTVSKERKVKKAEEITEELNKAFKLRLPVGSRKGNKKKVLIDGKEVWRSVASGQVQDDKGQPISVKSHNLGNKKLEEGK